MVRIGESVKIVSGPGFGVRGVVDQVEGGLVALKVPSGDVWWFHAEDVGSVSSRTGCFQPDGFKAEICQGCQFEGHEHVIGTVCQSCGH